jgi:hypothetical protein
MHIDPSVSLGGIAKWVLQVWFLIRILGFEVCCVWFASCCREGKLSSWATLFCGCIGNNLQNPKPWYYDLSSLVLCAGTLEALNVGRDTLLFNLGITTRPSSMMKKVIMTIYAILSLQLWWITLNESLEILSLWILPIKCS